MIKVTLKNGDIVTHFAREDANYYLRTETTGGALDIIECEATPFGLNLWPVAGYGIGEWVKYEFQPAGKTEPKASQSPR